MGSEYVIDDANYFGTLSDFWAPTEAEKKEVDEGQVISCAVFAGIALLYPLLTRIQVVVWHIRIKGIFGDDFQLSLCD